MGKNSTNWQTLDSKCRLFHIKTPMDAITLCGGHSVGVFLMERMVCGLGENEWVYPG